ncbi:hypothetical protein ANTQUA_LOCUS5830 [Anthophora quadrimaculata]
MNRARMKATWRWCVRIAVEQALSEFHTEEAYTAILIGASSPYRYVVLLFVQAATISTLPEKLLDHKYRSTRRSDYVISNNGLIAPVALFTRRT